MYSNESERANKALYDNFKLKKPFCLHVSKQKYFSVVRVNYGTDLSLSLHDRYVHFNPLSPHDAFKHHFTSLKTDLIFLQQRV